MILVNTGPTTFTKTWYVDGTATDVGTVTIGIVNADGDVIVAAETAVTDNGDGTYDYALPVQTVIGQLTVTWSTATQSQSDLVDIVGGWLFTEHEIRTFQNSDLASATTYPDAAIAEVRGAVTDEFEQICGVAFVPTYRRQTLPGTGTSELTVARPMVDSVIACTIGGSSVTGFAMPELLPNIHRTGGVFSAPSSADPYNVTISYDHGHRTVPPDIKQGALILARARLIANQQGTGVPAHASSWTDTSGTFTAFAASAKTQRWYGMPGVDIPLQRHNLNPQVT